jgi:hypothetical protein
MIKLNSKPLQEFATAAEQLVHWDLVGLPVYFIQRKAIHTFIDRVRDRELKQHLLMGSDRLLNEALNQALKLEVVKVAAGPPVRLREVTRAAMEIWLSPTKHCSDG